MICCCGEEQRLFLTERGNMLMCPKEYYIYRQKKGLNVNPYTGSKGENMKKEEPKQESKGRRPDFTAVLEMIKDGKPVMKGEYPETYIAGGMWLNRTKQGKNMYSAMLEVPAEAAKYFNSQEVTMPDGTKKYRVKVTFFENTKKEGQAQDEG